MRITEKDMLAAAATQGLPGRQVNGEWRFMRPAIQQWLCTSRSSMEMRKAAQMAVVGLRKDDPHLEDMLEEIFRGRGRPITEDGSSRLFHGRERGNAG